MSKVQPMASTRSRPRPRQADSESVNKHTDAINGDVSSVLDYTSSSSIIEFLAKEQDCTLEPADPETIFQEVNRLADSSDMRSVDELLLEAERLIQQQLRLGDGDGDGVGDGDIDGDGDGDISCQLQMPSTTPSPQSLASPQNSIKLNTRYSRCISSSTTTTTTTTTTMSTIKSSTKSPCQAKVNATNNKVTSLGNSTASTPPTAAEPLTNFVAFVDNLPSESVISEESTPKDLHNHTHNGGGTLARQLQLEQVDNTDDDEDTMEELTEAEDCAGVALHRRSSSSNSQPQPQPQAQAQPQTGAQTPAKARAVASSQPIAPMASYSEKAVGSSPKHLVHTMSSPIEQIVTCSVSREHVLKQEIEELQEQLKDTEERLASVRLQSESLSQTQRALREQNSRLQEESEMLKLDVQHLHECAGVLRNELQSARRDRDEAVQLERSLRSELEEVQQERRLAAEGKEKDARIIQDLQRQCREMERILMRKHPDSVSALIVASKSTTMCSLNDQENMSSRKLLEQRIAQLESDAKEQDRKAQQILANVQARFNSVQAKYETHIADLETQVLSLQEINTKLNEQIESQVRTLDRFMQKRADRYYNNCTQTDAELEHGQQSKEQSKAISSGSSSSTTGTQTLASSSSMRDHSTNTIGCPSPSITCQQHLLHHQQQLHSAGSSSTSSTANSTPNTSRPNSKQSGAQRRNPSAALGVSKLPISQSDSTLSLLSHGHGPTGGGAGGQLQDSQLLSSVRSMRIDLALKNKAMQRLTHELDDCKKTIRKLQRERERDPAGGGVGAAAVTAGSRSHGAGMLASGGAAQRRGHDHHHYHQHYPDHVPATTENQALKEAQNKFHLLEADYKTLHDKRLHDLKTLQSAHERELASCNETVRILQQRLNEREEAFATQKRRKVPVDYYALKAKVSLLERRHSEREERLHMLVEALSKGRLNGALEDLLQENNNK
ncbi:PREDICTED: centrosomal protein of 162 kDa [Drosophila arizonae]|uniref:Centrosomal protein of 162 kDa n=1 Tax=Drosophila arizonae TaxID=7263 RepID=A0ABM1PQW5_DROAR|nr:PREDICTED: centrosomal protein of 162 kDa [Drosophila arizonae]